MYAKTCQTHQAYPRKGQGYQDIKGTEKFNAKLLSKAEIIVGSANKIWGMSSVFLSWSSCAPFLYSLSSVLFSGDLSLLTMVFCD